MKTISVLLIATIGMSTDNYYVMTGALIITLILTLKTIKNEKPNA
jgi:multisubunit Na+/H+ antiporter MnhF subunit